jgi:hypothetical protein
MLFFRFSNGSSSAAAVGAASHGRQTVGVRIAGRLRFAFSASNASQEVCEALKQSASVFLFLHARLDASTTLRQILRKQRVHEFLGIEREQVRRLLSHAHVTHGNAQFASNRHHDTAFGGAIELSQDDTRNTG